MAPVYALPSIVLPTAIPLSWARSSALFGGTAVATLCSFVMVSGGGTASTLELGAYSLALTSLGVLGSGLGGGIGEKLAQLLSGSASPFVGGLAAMVVAAVPLSLLEVGVLSAAPIGLWRSGPTVLATNAVLLALVLLGYCRRSESKGVRVRAVMGGLMWAALALLSREVTALAQGLMG